VARVSSILRFSTSQGGYNKLEKKNFPFESILINVGPESSRTKLIDFGHDLSHGCECDKGKTASSWKVMSSNVFFFFEGYSIFGSKISGIGMAISIGPKFQKFIGIIWDEIPWIL
jgi:hypothetical protein